MSMIEIALREINGKEIPAVTSLQVAEHFGKEHRNVLADIRNTMDKCSESFSALNFQLSQYTSVMPTGGNKELPMYLLSKDGFMMVAMGYTTPEAMRIKEAYIARFNEMEKAFQANAPTSLPEALRAYANMLEENELIRRQRGMSSDLGYSVEKIATAEYPDGINAYHVDVIAAFRAELAQNPGMLDRYRKRQVA